MRLIIKGESIKINNFVAYLIENFNERGQTYEFEMHVDDKYDKKSLESHQKSLKDNILVLNNDSFEILNAEYIQDLDKFRERIKLFLDNESSIKDFTSENFANQFISYKIYFLEHEQKHEFNFSFINLSA